MHKLLHYLVLIPLLCGFNSHAQITTPSRIISAPADMNPQVLQDLVDLLGRSTGDRWTADHSAASKAAVLLQIRDNPIFKTRESFRLESNGRDRLVITSSSVEGLIFGIYKHLRNLGFKFYLPDDLYTVVPQLSHPFGVKKDIIDQPFLQIREFFGTGGFGSTIPDEHKTVEKDWNRWRWRNGFGASYQLAGHRGENFILENYELLKKHPSWLASPLTGDKHKDQSIKLNYNNSEALDFYVDWTIKPLTDKSFRLPAPGHSLFVSIEPSDGGGFPEIKSKDGKIQPVSDLVYAAANRAAEKLDQLFPNRPEIGVNLYAYSSHAAPPSFKLHPRVFVQLVPYQFQNIAFGPSFIRLWAAKARRFGLYDYLNYPDSQYDLPGGLTLDEAMKRLIHSAKHGSEGTNYETSYSKFGTGIPLWVMSRYMADGDARWEKNLDLLVRDLYGRGSDQVRELFGMFYRKTGFGPQVLGNAARLLQRAAIAEPDPLIQKRFEELKIYLQYASLVFQSRELKNGSLSQRTIPVAEFAWKVFPKKIIHSYRIMQLISYGFLHTSRSDKEYEAYQQLHVAWFPETDRGRSAWYRIPQGLNTEQIEKDFQTVLKRYPETTIAEGISMAELLKLVQVSGLQAKTSLVFGGSSEVRGYFGVYAPKPSLLTIRYTISGPSQELRISSIDKNYSYDTAIILKERSGTLQMRLPSGETSFFLNAGNGSFYRIQADISEGLFFFDGSPRGKMAFYKQFNDAYENYSYGSAVYPSYIFVPGKTELHYKVQLNAVKITSPTGRKIEPVLISKEHGGFENRKFDVQAAERNRIWKVEVSGNFNYQFFDIPERYLLLDQK